jgi:hypothetical protein
VGYILEGVGLLLIVMVMLRSALFSKAIAWVGILLGVMSLVPPSAGNIGIVFALGSLLPLEVWEILIARRLWQLGQPSQKQSSSAMRKRLRVLRDVTSRHPAARSVRAITWSGNPETHRVISGWVVLVVSALQARRRS